MNLSTNSFFTHGFDKLCTICHMILKDTDSSHSIFSTLAELETPMNVFQVLQSFSNFNFYNGPEMVCTTCYDKTIEVYKFIQMCNKAHENMQHYLKNVKDEPGVDVKIEEISIEPTRIIVDGREYLEMQNEKISKFDDLGMVISGTEIKIEERILEEGMKEEETSNNEELTISGTEIVTEEKTSSTDFDNLRLERINAQIHDERIDLIKCNECDLVFSDKKDLDNHLKETKRTKEQPFLGEVRYALFGTKYNLRSHDQRHISKDLWHSIRTDSQPLKDHESYVVCLDCQEVFCNDKQLKIHMRKSHKKAFLCNDCGKVFTTESLLNTHIRVHTDEKSITRGSDAPSSSGMPTDSHNVVVAYKCEQCDRRFTQAANLRSHMIVHTGVKAHNCEQCDRQFTHASSLRSHMDIHNGVKAHKCEKCDRRFTQASGLRSHMLIHSGVKAHKCEQCDRRFSLASDLHRHVNTHKGVKAHKCEQCDRRFTQASHLRTHMLIHNGVKPHKCEQCDRRFRQAVSLRSHMDLHTGVKAHTCEQCDRQFTHASSLRRHMGIHNGIKAHKCEQCDRRFSEASSLRTHMLIHNGVKAHKCEQCDRRFTLASSLRSHMLIHNWVKAHKCEQCDRRFTHASTLRRHIMTHNRKICTICNKAFDTSNALNIHLQSHNIVEEEHEQQIEETAEWEDQQ